MTNSSPTQSPTISDLFAYTPDATQLAQISSNWNILLSSSPSTILPSTLPPPSWSGPLLQALHTLSLLTIHQKDRAHSLLNTYFRARIREASYTGKQDSIYATLEVGDVEKAIASMRRMSKGLEMQGGKRKYSIREEVGSDEGEKERAGKKQRGDGDAADAQVESETDIGSLFKSNSASASAIPDANHIDQQQQQQHQHLPPRAVNRHSHSHSQSNSYSPPPPPSKPPLRPRLPPITTHLSTTPSPFLHEAQRLTHKFNVRRIELERAEVEYRCAKQRYTDALMKMEWAKGESEGWGDGWCE